MLDLRPNCECCDRDLPPDSADAMICSFECTFCRDCAQTTLGGRCPNCGGELVARPIRPAEKLATYPASTKRVLKTGRLRQSSNPTCSATEGTTCADLQTARAVPRRAGRDWRQTVLCDGRWVVSSVTMSGDR
jgi:hypothetical protein